MTFGTLRWVIFRICMLTACFALLIVFVAIFIAPWSQDISTYTGVIVSYGFSITNILNQVVITLVSFEGEMASVERVMEY